MNIKTDTQKISRDTILVVDDTPSNLQVLFTYLECAGFTVLLAQNGHRALQIVEVSHPDLILLDILMPDLDGFEICTLLKNQATTKEIPVIFLTALSETRHKIKGFNVGGVDYITKPIEQQEVLARIKTHLALRDTRQKLTASNQELRQEINSRQQIAEKLKQALNSEGSIRRITKRVHDSLDVKEVLQIITQELFNLLNLTSCQIEFENENQEGVTIINKGDQVFEAHQSILNQLANSVDISRQLAKKNSLQLNIPSPQNQNSQIIRQSGKQNVELACLVCPIFEHQNQIELDQIAMVGHLWLFRLAEDDFQTWEIELVEQISIQCAIAIRQARLYEASQTQVKELAKLNNIKDDFLKTISHELRSPMSSIQLAVETLEKLLEIERTIPQSKTFQRVIEIFRRSCRRQNQLVNNLLTLCHLDAQAETIVMEWIDLHSWIPEIVLPFQEQLIDQQQKLVIEVPDDLPELNSDPFILERVVQELINNACKYTPAKETITIRTILLEDQINLNIINSGITIPTEEQDLIFERFYRIPNNDPWQYGGTGLGLYLIKRLLELIDSHIDVISEDENTHFSIMLPLQLSKANEEKTASS